MTSFFTECYTMVDLKKAYKIAAMKYHPDCGGDTTTMQQVNAEYEKRVKLLEHPEQVRTVYRQYRDNAADELRRIHEYEVKVNTQLMEYNEQLRKEKAAAQIKLAKDPELAELINMSENEIFYDFRLIEWIANSNLDYYEGRNYVKNLRATLNAKEYVIRWETWPE